MQTDIQNIRLKFNCPANWEEMTPMAGGHFCDHCAKVVYDFTDAKQAEFQRILAENAGGICGRFRSAQMAPEPVLLPRWKHWLSAAMLLIGVNLFSSCKRELKGDLPVPGISKDSTLKIDEDVVAINGEVEMATGFVAMPMPEYPGGEERLFAFLVENIRWPKGFENEQGKVFVSFNVDTDGSVNDVKIIRGLSKEFDNEVLRVIKLMPKWKPAKVNGKPVKSIFTIPVNFDRTSE